MRHFYRVNITRRCIDTAETLLAKILVMAHKSVHLFYTAKRASFVTFGRKMFSLQWMAISTSVLLRAEIGGEMALVSYDKSNADQLSSYGCHIVRKSRVKNPLLPGDTKSGKAIKRKIAEFPENN